jgi:hypothetical protein
VGRGQEGGRGQASSQVGRETMKPTSPTSISTTLHCLLFPFVCLVPVYSGGLSWPPFLGVDVISIQCAGFETETRWCDFMALVVIRLSSRCTCDVTLDSELTDIKQKRTSGRLRDSILLATGLYSSLTTTSLFDCNSERLYDNLFLAADEVIQRVQHELDNDLSTCTMLCTKLTLDTP